MQAFFYESEEGEAEGLKLIEGKVKKFNMNSPKYKVPHMGWNNVEFIKTGKFKSALQIINFILHILFMCYAIMKKTF